MVPFAVTGLLIVNVDPLRIPVMTVPAGIVDPVSVCPTINPLVSPAVSVTKPFVATAVDDVAVRDEPATDPVVTTSVPSFTVTPPVMVFAPANVSVPLPLFTNVPAPVMAALSEEFEALS
jgi:hypothetical protein